MPFLSLAYYAGTCTMPNRIVAAQVSDTTGDASSNTAD